MTPIRVGLIRGINVGGQRRLPMADLRQLLEQAGAEWCKTLLQSGNFVMRGGPETAEEIELLIHAQFGFRPIVVLLSPETLDQIIGANPMPAEAEQDPAHLVVHVSPKPFSRELIESVRATNRGRERLELIEPALYVWCPDGIGTSSLPTAKGWNKLVSSATGRNWNTLLKIRELAQS